MEVWLSHNQESIKTRDNARTLSYRVLPPKGATSSLDRGSYGSDRIRVSLCLLCLVVKVYLVVLSCVFFCVVWFCLLVR